MKKNYTKRLRLSVVLIALLTPLASVNYLQAQTTVFTEDFNRLEAPLGNGGAPLMTWTTVTSSQGYTKTEGTSPNYRLAIYNGATSTAAATTGGRSYVHGPLSVYNEPFNPVLSSNTKDIIWTLNLRGARTNADNGFDGSANNYGYAAVLCATGSDFTTASGYAVTVRKGTLYNTVRLEKFTGGLTANANLTTIITGDELSGTLNHYYSVKVVYNPATNVWKFYNRIDGSNLQDPNGGSTPLTEVGTGVVESSLTATPMTHCGFLVNHQSTSWNSGNNKGNFDNFKVVMDNVSTAIHQTLIDKSVIAGEGKITLLAAGEIFSITGMKIASVQAASDPTEISVNPGIYLVRTEAMTTRVMVR